MDLPGHVHALAIRSAGGAPTVERPAIYKVVGIILAISSGLFIGTSFVVKKKGLLRANEKYHEAAGEGYGYLKNWLWWCGMTLMIIGEICNFVAYAFVDAILVTPLGALSVVVTTILSAIFLKERLSFVGKVGCFNCIVGSVVIVLNAPKQSSAATIQEMRHFVLAPGFLTYAGLVIVGCLFTALWAGPRYGKKTMLVYLTICSMIGGLSVVATQGLGAAIITQIAGTPQFNQWFLYVLLVFVIVTLLTEIVFLNKALNIFNAALVTPTYYVYFTSATIVTSAILFQGFKGSAASITTVVLGFLQICSGVVLLQLAKSSKDVPDTAIFKGDLDQVRTIAEQEEPESEPRADTIRGGASVLRAISHRRTSRQIEELEKLHLEAMSPIAEDEIVEWDGLRRRRTVISPTSPASIRRTKTLHPPLGMAWSPEGDMSSTRDAISPVSPSGRRNMHKLKRSDVNIADLPSPLALSNLKGSQVDREGRPHVFGLPSGLARSTDGASDMSLRNSHHSSHSSVHAKEYDVPRSKYTLPTIRPVGGLSPLGAMFNHSHAPVPYGDDSASRRTFSFGKMFHMPFTHERASASPAVAGAPDAHRSRSPPMRERARTPPARGHYSISELLHHRHNGLETEEERCGLVRGDSRTNLYSPERYGSSPPRPLPLRDYEQTEKERLSRSTLDEDEEWQHLTTARSSMALAKPREPDEDDRV